LAWLAEERSLRSVGYGSVFVRRAARQQQAAAAAVRPFDRAGFLCAVFPLVSVSVSFVRFACFLSWVEILYGNGVGPAEVQYLAK
jgi:hypothetical protein